MTAQKKEIYAKNNLIPESIASRVTILEITQSKGMYYNKYSDAEDCAEIHIKCKDAVEGEFYINMYYGIGYRDSETKTIVTVNREKYDGENQYGAISDEEPFFQELDSEISPFVENAIEEDCCFVYNDACALIEIESVVIDRTINRESPSLVYISMIETQLAELRATYNNNPENVEVNGRVYKVTAKFPDVNSDDAKTYISQNTKQCIVAEKDGYIYITEKSDKGIPLDGKLLFETAEEGKNKIIALYAKESEVTSGEFADTLYADREFEFDASIPVPVLMCAIQAFRAWDYEAEEGEREVEATVHMVHMPEDGFNGAPYWDNTYQDYMFTDGSFVPAGTRIGIENDELMVLDIGIDYSSTPRRSNTEDEEMRICNSCESGNENDRTFIQVDRISAEVFYEFAEPATSENTLDEDGEGCIDACIDVVTLPSLDIVVEKAKSMGLEGKTIEQSLELSGLKYYYSLIANSGKEKVYVYFDDNSSIGHHNINTEEGK